LVSVLLDKESISAFRQDYGELDGSGKRLWNYLAC